MIDRAEDNILFDKFSGSIYINGSFRKRENIIINITMYHKALIFAPVVCLVAPAMAEEAKEEAEEVPTPAEYIEASKQLFEAATKVLSTVKDATTAEAATVSLDQLTLVVKGVFEAGSKMEEPSEEEQEALAPKMKELEEVRDKLAETAKEVLNEEYATDALKASLINFINAFSGK